MRITDREIEWRIKALEVSQRAVDTVRSAVDRVNILPNMAECYLPVHEAIENDHYTFINLSGGRGSGKSSFASLELVYQVMQDEQSNALVIRKYANTLRGSVFNQIRWAIDVLGVSEYWQSTITPMEFKFISGQSIRLSGLDDPQKLKSLRPVKGYYRYLWIEEFSEITSEAELRNLQQSVLRGGDHFTVIRTYNPPISAQHWVNQFAERQDDESLTIRTDYRQMPVEWLGKPFFAEAERLKEINPRIYEHEYLGIPTGTGAEVFQNLEIRKISDDEINQLDYIFEGIDFGFAADPTVFLRIAYDNRTDSIYLLDEIYEHGLSNAVLADMIFSNGYHEAGYGQRQKIICDSADPRSISDLRSFGLKAIPCHKFAGCVQYRVRWLQCRQIIIDQERTPEAAREFRNYTYVVDRTGEITSDLPDRDNHTIDALAYGLDRIIYNNRMSA